jgi:hypothetical protein
VLKIRVLNASLDSVQGSSDCNRRYSTGDRRNKVLRPGSLVVVGDAEQIVLGDCGGPEKLERGQLRKPRGNGRENPTAKLPGALRAMVHPQPR